MNKTAAAVLLSILTLAGGLAAVTPQKWEVRSKDDFLKGKLSGLALTDDGALSLSVKEEKLAGPAEDFYLSLLAFPDGTLFLGTGHSGKVFRMGKDGAADIYFQAPEMDVTCLARDSKGALYVGTSPNGKIYKITEKGKFAPFFDPGEKYIWDMRFLENGQLLAAVGESGGIYRIAPNGQGEMMLKTESTHVLCLIQAPNGDIIAGSGGGGSIYKITAAGISTLLFEAPYEEIKSLAMDGDGNIYAAASGTPTRPRKDDSAAVPVRVSSEMTISAIASAVEGTGSVGTSVFPVSGSREPGALYKIAPDGMAKRLWSSVEEMVYSVYWNEAEKEVLAATGGKGRIYAVGKNDMVSLLLQENSEQVYSLVPVEKRIYVLANNPSYLGLLYPEQRQDGEYLSSVLDAKTVSSWGKVEWDGDLPAGAAVQILTRSGNTFEPNKTWNDWSPPYQKKEEQILSPKARYLQFKILFRSQSGRVSPQMRKMSLFYLQANLAPAIIRLELLPPNDVFLKLPDQDDVILGLTKKTVPEVKKDEPRGLTFGKKTQRKGYQTIIWDAEDENGDQLVYSLSVRKENEAPWRVLEAAWGETVYAFETISLPDGVYFIKIKASDNPSNPGGTDLSVEKESAPLVIDNSLPAVKGLTVTRNGNSLDVVFQAEDQFSSLEKVEYLVRPGDWKVVFPVDGICDSKSENFKFRVQLPAAADNLLTIRVQDRHGNMGVARQVF